MIRPFLRLFAQILVQAQRFRTVQRTQLVVLNQALCLELIEPARAQLGARFRPIRQIHGHVHSLPRRQHVLLELLEHIAHRPVAGHHIVATARAERNADAQVSGRPPNHIGEVGGGRRKLGLGIVVVAFVFGVPGVRHVEAGRLETTARVDVLAVAAVRIVRHAIVGGQPVSPALRMVDHFHFELERTGAMQPPVGVVGAQKIGRELFQVDGGDDFNMIGRHFGLVDGYVLHLENEGIE